MIPNTFRLQPARLHRAVQYAFLVFYVYVGLRFYDYAQWAMGASAEYVPKPASAAASLSLISSSTATLSEKSMTDRPAEIAS